MKTFLLQLSSDDRHEKSKERSPEFRWADHGMMFGDVGNIYFFICEQCGIDSIETNWDCG